MRAALIFIFLIVGPAKVWADPASDAALLASIQPLILATQSKMTSINFACQPPVCNKPLLIASEQLQRAALLTNCTLWGRRGYICVQATNSFFPTN